MWYFNGQKIEDVSDMPFGAYGFVYKISFNNGDFYIGKKNCYHRTNPEISKKKYDELKAAGKPVTRTKNKAKSKPGKPVWRYKIKDKLTETNWLKYCSSNDQVKERIASGETHSKEILGFYMNSKELTYREIEAIVKADCLDICECLNGNILGKIYKFTNC